MNTRKTLKFNVEVAAPPSQVYRAFASSQGFQEWMADNAQADAREGGRFYAWWNAGFYTAGFFKEAVEDKKVVFSWQSPIEPAPTNVEVVFEKSDAGTALTLTHSGLGEGEEWKAIADNFEREWNSSLAHLKTVLETGVDSRQFDRPMLGFFIGGLVDESMQERLGLPIDYGMQVAGLVEGMGAERSGLLADDVIASVDGVEVRDFQSLVPVMAQRKGGETVKAVVYRGTEKVELEIELSKRPVPDFPPAPSELAVVARKAYKDVFKQLKGVMKGATEEEASHRPGPGEWNAKEAMAHLLIAERWSHSAWDLHPAGGKFPSFPGSSRLVQSFGEAYKAKKLMKEIKSSMKVNVNMIELLPEDYAANKAAYFLSANNFEDGIRQHFLQHIEQIRAALAAARKDKE